MGERLNIRLAAGVLALAILTVGGTALLHRWQVHRHATGLLDLADSAESKGRLDRASWLFAAYLDLQPGDIAARARYGAVTESLAQDAKSRAAVADIYEQVLSQAADRSDIRIRLARLYVGAGKYSEATTHLTSLSNGNGVNAEVVHLLGVCQEGRGDAAAALTNYRRAIELDGSRTDWYVHLAILLRRNGGISELAEADRLVDRMVAANPQKARANLARARYQITYKTGDPTPDLAVAEQLAPTDPEVRLTAAAIAKSPEAASVHLRAALDQNPNDERLPLALAAVENRASNRTEAIAVLRKGLVRLPGNAQLLFALADLSIETGSLSEAERVLTEINRWKVAPERAVLLAGRLQMAKGNWQAALATLEAGRPSLTTTSQALAAEADVFLGRCHEQLGESDLALAAYRRAAAGDPTRTDVPIGIARTLIALDRLGEAVEQYQQLAAAPTATDQTRLMYARLRTLQYLSTPVNSRAGADLERAFKQAEEKLPNSAELLILRADVLSADKKPSEAEKLLRNAVDRHPESPELALPLTRLLIQHGNTAGARDVIDSLERKTGLTVEVALAQLELLAAGPTEHSGPLLLSIEQLLDRTERADDRLRLAATLAETQGRLGNLTEARRWLLEVARLRPQDLSFQLRLFELAVKSNDRAQMEQAVREIHLAEGGQGAYGHYAEVLLRIVRPEDRSPKGFEEARQHLTAALLLRPSWAMLLTSRAVLAELEGKPDDAIADYLRAVEELGERRSEIIRRAVQLLFDRRRYSDADRLMQKLRPETSSSAQIHKLAAEVSLFNLQPERAVELAAGAVAPDSKVYKDHLWQGEILAAAGRSNEALAAFRRAVESAGPHGEPWVSLVRYHLRSGQRVQAEQAFEELRRKLSGPELLLTVAQCQELLGRTEDAAVAYQAAVDAQPREVEPLHQLFGFHEREGTLGKIVPTLRKALATQPTMPPADTAWIQRALASALAMNKDYAAFNEAMRVVNQGLESAPNDATYLLTKARVLATRLNHRREALQILQQLQPKLRFGPDEEFFLGQLLTDTGNWSEGRRVLVTLLTRERDNPTYLRFFVDRLLRAGQISEAEAWLARLEELAPNDPGTTRLRATFLVKQGEFRDAVAYLSKAARPRTAPPTEKPEAYANRVRMLAHLADELGRESDAGAALFPLAETLYREIAKSGSASDQLALAGFIGQRGRIEEAMKLGRTAEEKAGHVAVAATLLSIAYGSATLKDAQLDVIEAELKACLSRAKPSQGVDGVAALMHARRGRYAEAAQSFKRIVDADGRNAEMLNNMAYMLLLSNARPEEVNTLLEKALALVGPTASILDTRGMLHLTAGRPTEAVTDLEQAVEQNPSAAKCLHLATAYHRAGRAKEAATLLARAAKLRTDGTLVLLAEQTLFEELSKEIKPPR